MDLLAFIKGRRGGAACGLPVSIMVVSALMMPAVLYQAGGAARHGQEFRVPGTVGKALTKTMPVQVEVIGNVEAYSTVSVRTQWEIEKAYFTQGQDVKKGELLFTLDRRPFEAALHQFEANLARDEAQLANARAQAERNNQLYQEGIISKDQYEPSTPMPARWKPRSGLPGRHQKKGSQLLLHLLPPHARTGSYQMYPGNIAKLNDTVLVVINQIHPIYVTYAVPEQYLAEVRQYQTQGPWRSKLHSQ